MFQQWTYEWAGVGSLNRKLEINSPITFRNHYICIASHNEHPTYYGRNRNLYIDKISRKVDTSTYEIIGHASEDATYGSYFSILYLGI